MEKEERDTNGKKEQQKANMESTIQNRPFKNIIPKNKPKKQSLITLQKRSLIPPMSMAGTFRAFHITILTSNSCDGGRLTSSGGNSFASAGDKISTQQITVPRYSLLGGGVSVRASRGFVAHLPSVAFSSGIFKFSLPSSCHRRSNHLSSKSITVAPIRGRVRVRVRVGGRVIGQNDQYININNNIVVSTGKCMRVYVRERRDRKKVKMEERK